MLFDLLSSAEMIAYILSTGAKTFFGILIGVLAVFLMTSLREPDPIFFRINLGFNLGFFFFASMFTVYKAYQRVAEKDIGWWFLEPIGNDWQIKWSILFFCLIIVATTVGLSVFWHPSKWRPGIGVRMRPGTYGSKPIDYYHNLLFTSALRNCAVYITLLFLFLVQFDASRLAESGGQLNTVLSTNYWQNLSDNAPIVSMRLLMLMILLPILGCIFFGLGARNYYRAKAGDMVRYRDRQMSMIAENYRVSRHYHWPK